MHVCVFTCVCVPGTCQPLSVPRDGVEGAQCLFLCTAGLTCPQSARSQAPPPGHYLPRGPLSSPWAQLGFTIAHISWGSFVGGGLSLAHKACGSLLSWR